MSASAPTVGLEGARPVSLWIDAALAPEPQDPLVGDIETDLLIVGGGYTGLWTAILAKEEDPARRVVLLESGKCGHAGSGRNGGFCSPSLTHGLSNGLKRWPKEIDTLVRLGLENLHEIEQTLKRHGVEADFQMTGRVAFARTEWEAEGLKSAAVTNTAHGDAATFIPREELSNWTTSPAYVAGMYSPNYGLVDPYKLVLSLRRICLELGVLVYESTPAISVEMHQRECVTVVTPRGTIRAQFVALATNFTRPLLKRMSLLTVPVYDYAIVTEPLSEEQFASIGWRGDVGHTDSGNQFHYYRKTPDGRILWGGYDAIYNFGSARDEEKTQRPETFEKLAAQFRATYPQLADVTFTHQWGGVIDSSTRFCMTTGTAARGRVAYAIGFTGLGVSASRFGGRVMLDLLSGRQTERTRLAMIRRGAFPFPPEPIRFLGVQLTRWSMAREDATGRRNLWLRLMDWLGLGFDS
ncbi:FAD-dependent oxidoreductase [Alpinimonas psychrophila]|uniref:Glycine/D-amino acid oxidase-like deaminating enzyme n=1 Tax=Alpinimonas psychrophila TaxID=748908 RepID=A0A7W3JRR1_9MICO|nr:FAD-dependent oxidoreductase [Alpinimonas psychrophila]MBA8827952.1 glycine/D-amino acid oxidase-like deaminating enzyme [Alpinimonas psychrophila]